MRVALWRVSAVSLLVASCAFILTAYVDADWNRQPVQLPLPAGGVDVKSWFNIVTYGSFHLRVETPRTGVDQTRVPCNLRMTITSSSGGKTVMRIDHLEHTAQESGIDIWESQSLKISWPGDYDISLANEGATLFADRGAFASLERDYRPTETYLRMLLTRGIGWLALAVGVFTAVCAALVRLRRR